MSNLETLDNLFKPALPSNKRKIEISRHPNDVHKSVKISSRNTTKIIARTPSELTENDIESGPTVPIDEEDYGPDLPDDEEGRFFGGGVTQKENEILDYVDEKTVNDQQTEIFDSAWLRRLALKFERKISTNAELRIKYENDPQKFMTSEEELDVEIKAIGILSQHPTLYAEFVKLGCVSSLVSLLAHENTDIAIGAIQIISELIDEDAEAVQGDWNEIVDAMLKADLLELLVSNLMRFDEENESDKHGVYYSLSVLESMASQATLAEKIGRETAVFEWVLERIKKPEKTVSQNKQYAAEVLVILLQTSSLNRKKICEIDGVNLLLELLATYRKRDPAKGTEEEEFMENLFDALVCVVDEVDGKSHFVKAEGVELCLIMITEGKMSKTRAIRLLDHALGGTNEVEVSERLVEAAGLKVIFGKFMKKHDSAVTEHFLGIFSSLLRNLPADSSSRIRTLAKFVEKDYEKIIKLIDLRKTYTQCLARVNESIRKEHFNLSAEMREAMANIWLSRKLDAGLYCLQIIDVILAWLVAEDDGANQKIRLLLADQTDTIESVAQTIKEQIDAILEETEDEIVMKDMLTTLLKFLT
ncbi:BgtA-21376 [Blumeria graminis f. sp. tritici]|uniref:BgtA-21376 n=2 Tax=Blumeria graminis f. sp. tritici TaxID=62690 RepID=A0A9X9LBB6_BLUGR|nr:hypothetical protein BGT96224_A21376 [Blumeria graminis f. sp. tritici 96224]VCU41276.1 BgtA-21376 [Blumeria graminis f. sp. tritici]